MPRFLGSTGPISPRRVRFFGSAVIACMLLTSTAAHAADTDLAYDARIGGYQTPTNLQDPGGSLNYVLLAVMSLICIGALFKDPKRTHLD